MGHNQSIKLTLLMTLIISLSFIVVNEIVFNFFYSDFTRLAHMDLVFLVIVLLYSVATYFAYSKKRLGFALINIILGPIVYFIFLLFFGSMTDIPEGDLGLGFFLIGMLIITEIALISGTILGILIKLIVGFIRNSKSPQIIGVEENDYN